MNKLESEFAQAVFELGKTVLQRDVVDSQQARLKEKIASIQDKVSALLNTGPERSA